MRVRFVKTLAGITVTLALAANQVFAQAPQKKWKDQDEYNLFVQITKEADPKKKIDLLDSYKQKYPNTDYKQERLQLYLQTYLQLNQAGKLIETAKEMLANDPKEFQALYWITFLSPSMNDNSAGALAAAEQAANGMMQNVGATFSADKKPPATSEADWKKASTDMQALAQKTLGWVAWQRKDFEAGEKFLTESLKLNPAAGEVSYWLGTVIFGQKKAERQSDVLYHFARAANYSGPGAIPEPNRKQVDAFFVKAYNNFHGPDAAGLEELRKTASANAFPPEGYKIPSVHELDADKQKKLAESNPQLALWLNVKKELIAANGEQYFAENVKNAAIPKLRGKVVSQKPPKAPNLVVVGIENSDVGEVTLKLDAAFANAAEPGTEIEWEGIPSEFTKEPFMVTFDTEKAKVTGWPKPVVKKAAPAPKKAAPAAKKK